jgi:hypothetical protein
MTSTSNGSNKSHFNGLRVFPATTAQERDQLGEKIRQWISAHPGVEIVDKIVTQSSDSAFHFLSIALFFNDPK